MRTPRPVVQRRGIGTLIGNGWLHESPKNVVIPRGWDIRSKSAMRKCLFMPSPFAALGSPTDVSPVRPLPAPKPKAPVVYDAPARQLDPSRKARVMPAYVPPTPYPARPHHAHGHASRPVVAWYEDPIALGSLLILIPPIGLAALWSSKRYSSDARWALTIMTGLTMSLTAAVFVAALILRH